MGYGNEYHRVGSSHIPSFFNPQKKNHFFPHFLSFSAYGIRNNCNFESNLISVEYDQWSLKRTKNWLLFSQKNDFNLVNHPSNVPYYGFGLFWQFIFGFCHLSRECRFKAEDFASSGLPQLFSIDLIAILPAFAAPYLPSRSAFCHPFNWLRNWHYPHHSQLLCPWFCLPFSPIFTSTSTLCQPIFAGCNQHW